MIASPPPSANPTNARKILDTDNWEKIVIVPPEPEAFLSSSKELSYSHLYGEHFSQEDSEMNTIFDSSGGGTAVASGSDSSFDSNAFSDMRGGGSSGNVGADGTGTGTEGSSTAVSSAVVSSDTVMENSSRDPSRGAFTFQVNSEYDLLLHIQRSLDRNNVGKLTDVESARVIMRSVDEYCTRKQWMYHIGSDKGVHIAKFTRKAVAAFLEPTGTGRVGGGRRSLFNFKKKEPKKVNKATKPRPTFVAADLGTYCGYSAMLIAATLRECLPDDQPFMVYTTETSPKLLQVAKSMFRMAKMDKFITTILVDPDKETTADALLRSIAASSSPSSKGSTGVDFALFDHAKNIYLTDLVGMERAGLVRAGTHVAADNVVFNRLESYRSHVRKLADSGVVETSLIEMPLEYSDNLEDGIELTIYLDDPPTK